MKKTVSFISFHSFFLTVFLFVTVSCVTVKPLPNLSPVFVTNTKSINLLPPEDIQNDIDTLYALNIEFGNEKFYVITLIQADKSGIFLSLMNDFGTDMGSLEYTENSAVLDCSLIPEKLKPEYLIADLQNAFYDASAVKQNLNASRLNFEVEQNETGEVRRILNGSKLIEKIEITENEIKIKNYLRNYEYSFLIME